MAWDCEGVGASALAWTWEWRGPTAFRTNGGGVAETAIVEACVVFVGAVAKGDNVVVLGTDSVASEADGVRTVSLQT